MRREKRILLDGLGNEIKMPKKEKRERREKRYSKNARAKKILLKEMYDKKETQMIKNEIAGYLKGSNGYHAPEQKLSLEQNGSKPTTLPHIPHETKNKTNVKKSPLFLWITWEWLKKTLWWFNIGRGGI